jgi:hypothetical protein
MLRIPFYPHDLPVFHLQQETTPGMTQTAIRPPWFAHVIYLLANCVLS